MFKVRALVCPFVFFARCWHILIWLCNSSLFYHFKHIYLLVPSVGTTFSFSIVPATCLLFYIVLQRVPFSLPCSFILLSPFRFFISSPLPPLRSLCHSPFISTCCTKERNALACGVMSASHRRTETPLCFADKAQELQTLIRPRKRFSSRRH